METHVLRYIAQVSAIDAAVGGIHDVTLGSDVDERAVFSGHVSLIQDKCSPCPVECGPVETDATDRVTLTIVSSNSQFQVIIGCTGSGGRGCDIDAAGLPVH